MEGLQSRDAAVFEEARKRQIPVATVLAGGYALTRRRHRANSRQHDPGCPHSVAAKYPQPERSSGIGNILLTQAFHWLTAGNRDPGRVHLRVLEPATDG